MTTHRGRICFVTTKYPPHPGGAARSARRLVQGLAATGFDVIVFSPIPPDQQRTRDPWDGPVAVRWVQQELEVATRAIADEDAVCPFDVFHGFTLRAAYPCLDVAASRGKPVVASIRGVDGMEFDQITTEVVRRCDWVTSVSRDSLTRAAAVADLSQRSCVIPNGIDIDRFSPWRQTDANRGVVGTVATFRVKKNIPLLIRAYARLSSELRRQLLLVGDTYEEERYAPERRRYLDDLIDDIGLRDEVVITGLVDNQWLPEYHQCMSVFALSSDHEGMPNSILEAAASGLPIVATAVDGIKDIFSDSVDALLVPPGDEAALASALERVLADDALACRLSAEARRTATRLSVPEELQRYVELYDALLAARAVQPG